MRTPLRLRPTPFFRYSPLVAALSLALAPQAAMGATFTVTNNLDSGAGSLRQAILDVTIDPACGIPTSTQIVFSGGPFVVTLATPLPEIQCAGLVVVGDGTAIDGQFLYGGICGLRSGLVSPNVTIRNMEVLNFAAGTGLCGGLMNVYASKIHNNQRGIEVTSSTNVGDGSAANRNYIYANTTGIYADYGGTINGNYIGVLADGVTAAGNTTGIEAFNDTQILNNVISGNSGEGILVSNSGFDVVISGNKIGTNAAGTAALGANQSSGIYVEFSYGGPAISNNTISGNTSSGVAIYQSGAIALTSNRIGTNGSGNAAIPNGVGVGAICAGALMLTSNTISGNSGGGLYFGAVDGSTLSGNRIGVASSGTTPIANGGDGVHLGFFDCGTFDLMAAAKRGKSVRTAKSLALGGSNSNDFSSNNIIANNSGAGIAISSGGANTILTNSIHSNAGKNIALDMYGGPLPNDTGDADDGVNSLQNYPVVDSVTPVGPNTQVCVALDTLPGAYQLQVFKNTLSGPPAGEAFIGSAPMTVTLGPVSTCFVVSGLHDHISLTATNPAGDTSEFSPMADVALTPNRTINPTTVNFGSVSVDQVSATRTVTINSNGTAPYMMFNIASGPSCYGGPICYGGDFMCSTTCTTETPYAPGQSCQITGSFAPSFLGPQTTTIAICDNVNATPTVITLQGEGVVPALVTLTPTRHNFGGLPVGTTSNPQRFLVSNSNEFPVPIFSVTTLGQFRLVSTTCRTSIAALGSCEADVVFQPTSPGQLEGSLVVRNSEELVGDVIPAKSAPASPPVVATLSGSGVDGGALVMPPGVDLGTLLIGSAPNTATVELRNGGSAAINLNSITVAGPFTLVNGCPAILAAGAVCQLQIGFTSTIDGEFTGSLTVLTDASGGSRTIPVTARAQRVPRPVIRVAPVAMGFGDRLIGTQSATQRITVSNEGGIAANLSPLGSSSVEFLIVNTSCGLSLGAGSTCFADVAMRPLGFSARSGLITFTSNAEGSPHSVNLFGTGCRPNSFSGGRFGNRGNCSP